ncbi:CTP-dependent riboflavin kinase [Candidatus Woesearchaeota archaeon]|nr:CTP-dependent riboflavin kinase [Candidatus Woesearchaeota archaeon]
MRGVKTALHGIVSTGVGDGAFFMSLEPYMLSMEKKLGYAPFKGTLNLKVDKQQAKKFISSLDLIKIGGFKKGIKQFGKVYCYPCMINQIKCAIIIPEFTRYGLDIVEVISEFNLREILNLKDGDRIKIELL